MKLLIGLSIICLSICYGQETKEGESRLEQLEKNVTAMQDFLHIELQNLKNSLKQQTNRTSQLRKRNNFLLKKIKFLESKVKDLESQILQNKVKSISEKPLVAEKKIEEVKSDVVFQNKKVRALAKEMVSPNADIRMGAVIKLGNINHKESITLLNQALKDSNPYVKVLACKVAANKNSKLLVENLFLLLGDGDTSVRKHASLALEKITNTQVGFDHKNSQDTRNNKIVEWKKKVNYPTAKD
ncbi:HEAT repeat domain-containing protein [Candidatus Uabimicrobium sp. HlEnr_7]|uniref:HEAT repeat domain-containing protein n=1 Tax=Candidatus Uabimicrobium helgolandensis TaxID=3095367 RepID=UPI003557F889